MAVIVQYIVEKNGIQKMTFDNKKEAEAYDKTLDIAANMWTILEKSKVDIEEEKMEELCMFLATNKDEIMTILKGASNKAAGNTPAKEKAPAEADSESESKKSKEKPTAKDNSTKTDKNKKQAA